MKRLSVTKILTMISVIVIILGIIIGIGVSNSIENSIPNESIYVDGSDFSGIVQITGIMGSKIIGTLIVFLSFIIDAFVWIVYGIILLIINILKKIKTSRISKDNKGVEWDE